MRRPRRRATRRDSRPTFCSRSAPTGTEPVCDAEWREHSKFSGRIRSISVRKVDGTPTLECTLTDGSGSLLLVFQGRSHIPGIERGARLVVEGTVGSWQRKLAIINPDYELVAGPESSS